MDEVEMFVTSDRQLILHGIHNLSVGYPLLGHLQLPSCGIQYDSPFS